jgi:hypothetical protein
MQRTFRGVPLHRWVLGCAYMLAMGVCGIVLVALGSTLDDIAANLGTTGTHVCCRPLHIRIHMFARSGEHRLCIHCERNRRCIRRCRKREAVSVVLRQHGYGLRTGTRCTWVEFESTRATFQTQTMLAMLLLYLPFVRSYVVVHLAFLLLGAFIVPFDRTPHTNTQFVHCAQVSEPLSRIPAVRL